MAQSKVRGETPSPLLKPKTWFTTVFFGAAQQIKVKVERAVNRKPGRK